MSKFNNPTRTLGEPPPPPLGMIPTVVRDMSPHSPPPVVDPARPGSPAVRESPFIKIGFQLFCLLMISGYLNDWSYRLLGGKAYLSSIAIVLVPVAWLLSGQSLKGFRDRVGILWLCFLLLLLLGVPFSVWRSGSLDLISSYTFRALNSFFYIVTFASTLKRCRSLLLLIVGCSFIVLLTCVVFGQAANDGRFRIPDSIFFANSNDLALQIVLGITAFLFLFYVGGIWRSILAAGGILLSISYILKTGSRGCLISTVVLFVVVFIFTKRKLQIVLLAIPMVIVAIMLSNAASLKRLATIFSPPSTQGMSEDELSALQSKAEREELIRKGVLYTMTHPVFGVGAGQFAVAVAGDAAKKGEYAAWLGTHNSYTQVSAECGIPAFLCYFAIIVISFRRSYRIYRAAHGKPQFLEIEGIAFCLFTGVIVYAVATFFFHMAYTGQLPLLAGQVVALENAVGPMLFTPGGRAAA